MAKITKLEDAIDVVGQDHKEEVLELEKKTSLDILEKSHFDELVERSTAEAEAEVAKAGVLDVEDKDINGARDLFVGMFFKMLVDKGVEITQDELSKQVDKLLQGLSYKSETEDTVEKVASREDVSQADKKHAEKEYGDVAYADEKNKKYPIDTEEHIRAAWNYINKEANASKYSSEDVTKIKHKIVAAWKSKIDKEGPPSAEKSDVEKCEDMWMPYGGATTLAEAKAFEETNDLLNKIYYAYSVFGALASNIMNSEAEVSDKVSKLNGLFGEFQKNLTPDKLKELSEVQKMETNGVDLESVKAELKELRETVKGLVDKTEVVERSASVAETPVEKTNDLHPLSQKFNDLLKDVLAQEGDARKAGLQSILNGMGQDFEALAKPEVAETAKSEVANQEVLRALVDEKLNPVIAQITQMGTMLQNIAQTMNNVKGNRPELVQPPVQKAVVTMPQKLVNPIAPPTPSAGASIRDIVKFTTVGR